MLRGSLLFYFLNLQMAFSAPQTFLIERYEDRWFFENPKPETSHYCLTMMPPEQLSVVVCNFDSLWFSGIDTIQIYSLLAEKGAVVTRSPLNELAMIVESDSGHHKLEGTYGNFAWDLQVYQDARFYKHDGIELLDHFSWDAKVFSPIAGTVVAIENQAIDNPVDLSATRVFQPDERDPNYILIHVAGPFYFVLVHFQQNSIPDSIKIGTVVAVGDYLGKIGNSGVSYWPHLHMTTYFYDETLQRMLSIPTLLQNEGDLFQPKKGFILR